MLWPPVMFRYLIHGRKVSFSCSTKNTGMRKGMMNRGRSITIHEEKFDVSISRERYPTLRGSSNVKGLRGLWENKKKMKGLTYLWYGGPLNRTYGTNKHLYISLCFTNSIRSYLLWSSVIHRAVNRSRFDRHRNREIVETIVWPIYS